MTQVPVDDPDAQVRVDEPLIVVSSDTHVSPPLEGDPLVYLPVCHRRESEWLT